jgi:hypothetical protein
MASQQVMSPTDLDEFSSFIEEKNPAPTVKKEPTGGKQGQEEKVTMAVSDLNAIRARLLQLENFEKSQRENEAAKKDASRIFGEWDKEMSKGLNLDDLDQSRGRPQENPYPWRPEPPPMLGVPTPKQKNVLDQF